MVCFELYQGNISVAVSHASIGLGFIKISLGGSSLLDWKASGVDVGLLRVFLRLEQISLTSALQSLTRSYVNMETHIPEMVVHDFPSEFTTYEEARMLWRITVRRISTSNTESHRPDSSTGHLRQWSSAFQPLLAASLRESGKRFRLKAAFLQLRHITTLLALVGSQADSELVYDNFVSVFEENLRLARDTLGPPSDIDQFSHSILV